MNTEREEIIKTFEACGCSVECLDGFLDSDDFFLLGFKHKNFLVEVILPDHKSNIYESEFFMRWKGDVDTVRSVDQALNFMNQRLVE